MEISIPDMYLVKTPRSLVLLQDPARVFALSGQTDGYNALAEPLMMEVNPPKLKIEHNDVQQEAYVRTLNINGNALVLNLLLGPTAHAYVYVREGERHQPWQVATKMLVQPVHEQAGRDEGWRRRDSRVLTYVALATQHNWF